MQLIPHILLMLEGFSTFLDETCDADCDNSSPVGDWRVEKLKCIVANEACFPCSEQLRRLCPKTLQFLNCKSRALEDCEELAAAPNTNLSVFTKYSMKMENIVRDVCNENSSFHKDYVSKINCYKRMYFKLTDYCWNMFNETERDFIEYLDLTDKEISDEIKCLMIGYQDACLAEKFLLFCGIDAQRIFVTTQRIFQDIFSLDCSQVDEELKLKFFSFCEKMWKISFEGTFGIV
ncbi:hypothetical protein AVEN_75575-1 [Araneus ventricosus]|uniref:DUF19 domain-containing protein n=1 Tax=Araneus ventricosus TaxID=182803 RepID=A0A4Y2CKZ9_ARAVE|nr:hypothetical protein AVEN_75575-1 [Araneus ventricosus]